MAKRPTRAFLDNSLLHPQPLNLRLLVDQLGSGYVGYTDAHELGEDYLLRVVAPRDHRSHRMTQFDHPASLENALSKALLAANLNLNKQSAVLLSIADHDKAEAVTMIRELHEAGCKLYATEGTAAMISAMGMPVTMVSKMLSEGSPTVVDLVNDGTVSAVINTLSGDTSVMQDGFYIRRAAVERQTPCFTSALHQKS